MNPRDVEVLLDDDLGILERLVGAGLVADLPVPDVVVLLFAIFADEGGARLQRLDRIDHDRQRFVVDLDRVDAVGRDVALGRHDRGDLLRLIEDRVGRKDHLLVAHERRHPVQVERHEVLARDDRDDARNLEGLRGVDVLDPGVRERAPRDVQVEHAGQLHVVDVLALSADEARVFLALDALADTADLYSHCL